jgi:hypothetical protein
VRPILFEPSLDPVGPIRVACSPGRELAVARTEPPRPPPPAIIMRPLRQLLRPSFGHPQALGEHVVTPHSLPGRERRRLAGIRPVPPPFHARGLTWKAPGLSRVFPLNQGYSCEVPVLRWALSAKEHLQWYSHFAGICKISRKS